MIALPALTRRKLLTLSAAAPGLIAADGAPQNRFHMHRVSDRCWAAIALPWATVPQCNSAIFVGAESVAVVDAQATMGCALALRRQIRDEITDKPIRYVFLTHHHLDHAHGAAAYRDVSVVSSQATKELLRQEETWLKEYSAFRNPLVPSNDRLFGYYEFLDSALLRKGRELARTGNTEWTRYFEERRTVPLAVPPLTFTGEFRVDLGHLELRASTPGPAHTAGDVVIYAPSERTVATGDLLNSFEPLLFEADVAHWSEALHQLATWSFENVIPGHGQVQRGKGRLQMFTGYLDELRTRVSDGLRAGQTVEHLEEDLTPATIRVLVDGYGAELRHEYSFYSADPHWLESAVRGNVRQIASVLSEKYVA
jgi:glyoxylase-like metal-dependent hydrolase (beta-lactamase superfamily II)